MYTYSEVSYYLDGKLSYTKDTDSHKLYQAAVDLNVLLYIWEQFAS